MRGLGTLLNLATVAAGGTLGLFVGDRLPDRMRVTIMQGLGLVTFAVAVTGFEPLYDADLGLRRFIILIGAIIAGGLVGEALNLEDRLERLGIRIKERFQVKEDPGTHHLPDHSSFVEGFVAASASSASDLWPSSAPSRMASANRSSCSRSRARSTGSPLSDSRRCTGSGSSCPSPRFSSTKE